jgi:dihydrofolate reductase
MRKIVTFNRVSADGYFSAADGNLDWAVQDPEIYKAAAGSMADVDTILFGRRTYEMFESAWRPRAEGKVPATDPHRPGQPSSEANDQAKWIHEANKVVFSRTLKDVTWKNTRLVNELTPRAVETLKSESGKDMIIFGSGTVASQLAEHGLIDEYLFVVTPVILGNGKQLITGVSKRSGLELVDSKPFKSGNVMLHYRRAR